jgi:dTDP-4-amino-4,6-dideoxygalactose transaminase
VATTHAIWWNNIKPVFVDMEQYQTGFCGYGRTRDELYNNLKEHNICGRRYFHPLISSFQLTGGWFRP